MKNRIGGKIIILLRIGITILLLVLLSGVCRIFVADVFVVPSSSMEPTIIPGDVIVVNKLLIGARIYTDYNFSKEGGALSCWRTRGLRKIKYNDIVVYNRPIHRGKISFVINDVLCKRVVALPGDTIAIRGGYYENNNFDGQIGVLQQQSILNKFDVIELSQSNVFRTMPKHHDAINWSILNFGPLYVPRKGDAIRVTPSVAILYKRVIEWELGEDIRIDKSRGIVLVGDVPLEWMTFKHNYYFMAGDNVLDSADSRYHGFVPEEYIVGIASHVLYSKDLQSAAFQWSRFGKKL